VALKEAPDICHSDPVFIAADGQRSFHERTISESAEETNSIEEIRFPNAVGARDAGKWPETDVHINEVFEARDFQAS